MGGLDRARPIGRDGVAGSDLGYDRGDDRDRVGGRRGERVEITVAAALEHLTQTGGPPFQFVGNPNDEAVAGPGQRDVQQAEALSIRFRVGRIADEHGLAALGLLVSDTEEIDKPLTLHKGVLRMPPTFVAPPQEGAEHDGELETLRLEHREHLDGVVVAVDAPLEQFRAEFVVGTRRPTVE